MVFIDRQFDLTLSPADPSGQLQMLRSTIGGQRRTFDEARLDNAIYSGNGAICQRKMCASMTGCQTKFGCPKHKDWSKVQQFCGPYGTPALYSDGALWKLQNGTPAALQARETAALGFSQLPDPYNVMGMYTD